MKNSDFEDFIPVFTIGYLKNKFICGVTPTEDGIDPQQVIGACISIIDSYLSMLPEADQNVIEDAIFEAIAELKENRHEYLEKINIENIDEEDDEDDF
jgi:hypothetical protein